MDTELTHSRREIPKPGTMIVRPALTPADADFAAVIEAWSKLAPEIHRAVMALVNVAAVDESASPYIKSN